MYTVDVTFKYADISSGGFYMAIIVMSFIAQIVLVLLYSFWFMPLVSLPRINWWIIVSQYVTSNMNLKIPMFACRKSRSAGCGSF